MLKELLELKNLPFVGDVRGKGLLIGIEMVENKATKEPADEKLLVDIIKTCKAKGLIIGKTADTVAGFNNILTLAPPLSITEEDSDFIVKTLKESIREVVEAI